MEGSMQRKKKKTKNNTPVGAKKTRDKETRRKRKLHIKEPFMLMLPGQSG